MAEYLYTSHPTKRRKNGKNKGKACSCPVHIRVWIEHHGEIPKGLIVHHKDGNKFNNSIDNLELVSRSNHAHLHSPKGVNRLTE